MKWTEITIFADEEGLDAVAGRLAMLGVEQAVIEQGREEIEAFLRDTAKYWDFADLDAVCSDEPCVKAYVADIAENEALIKEIHASFRALKKEDQEGTLGTLRILTRVVDDEDWANSWKAHYKPFPVGEKLMIRPSWEQTDTPEGRIVLSLDPGMAFGSGTHETTRMCLEALQAHTKEGMQALDLGCGSGILAIAALLLGAKSATLVDIDPVAQKVAAENARMNGIAKDRYEILIGDTLSDQTLRARLAHKRYDLITANIVASVVIALAPLVREVLAEDGIFIASGIIDERLAEVLAALDAHGFEVFEVHEDENWRQLAAGRKA